MKYNRDFIVALDIDETFLDYESHSLMLVSWQKAVSPVTFYTV